MGGTGRQRFGVAVHGGESVALVRQPACVAAGATRDTELAKGRFDLRAFLAQVKDLNKKPCFVEQEGSADELASARENYGYLKSLTW